MKKIGSACEIDDSEYTCVNISLDMLVNGDIGAVLVGWGRDVQVRAPD